LHGADGVVYPGETVTPVADLSDQEPGDGIVGQSPAFLKAVERLRRAGRADTPVLIAGESGTGKELASRLVHEHSARSKGPFITVDCTVLGEGLIESELFGHERGAFTGSSGSKKGLFELADGGTLFLDELGELPLELQAKLLRAVEYGTFRRVGGTRTLQADVRVVAATNRSLGEMVREGRFRQDLFYRLAVFTVRLPPLRERPEDLQALVERFLAEMRTALDRPVDISPEALRRLQRHDFPGNIRELRNVMQVAATLCDQDVIGPDDLEFSVPERPLEDQQAEVEEEEGLKPLHKVEATYIGSLLRKYDFDRVKVAEAMGVSTRTLSRKMKRYNLNA
jgi:transcriptional regulator with PAS, ATPase and Fis domain